MVRGRGEGRSRGCSTCIQRRMKCDGKLPACGQCQHAGKICPGPAQGFIFLVETASKGSSQKSKPKPKSQATQHNQKYGPIGDSITPDFSGPIVLSRAKDGGILNLNDQDVHAVDHQEAAVLRSSPGTVATLPMIKEVAASNIWTSQCISQLLSICSTGGVSWISQLFVQVPFQDSSLIDKVALAASLAWLGDFTNDRNVLMEAQKWYGLGVTNYRQQLIVLAKQKRKPTTTEIYMPFLLCLFELVMETTSTAYWQHIMGVEELLLMRGPIGCASKDVFPIFRIFRALRVYIAIQYRKPSIFATKDWLIAPFVGHPKDVLDDIIDILILTPLLYSYLDEIVASTSTREITKIKAKLEFRAIALTAELSKIGRKLDSAMGKPAEGSTQIASPSRTSIPATKITLLPMVLAYCHIAQIVILSVMTQAKPSDIHQHQIIVHCESILSNVEMALDVDGFQASLVGPLSIAQLLSPDVEQKRRAGELLVSLYTRGGTGAKLAERMVAQMRHSTDERWIRRDINVPQS